MYPDGNATAIAVRPAIGPIVVSGRRFGKSISSAASGAGINSSSDASRTIPPSANGTSNASYEIAPPSSQEARPTVFPLRHETDANVH
ncbi:MAG: hypothetical protein WCB01_12595, partial [Candidatus Cybelea sp.]